MPKKRIAIVSNFSGVLNGTKDDRFVYIAEMLAATGRYDVELIASDFVHHKKTHQCTPDAGVYSSKVTLCHEPGYRSHKGLRRLYSHRMWGKNVLRHIKQGLRPDIVYCAIPSLTAARLLARYCKTEGIKFVIDVQDLWPEATFMLVKNKAVQKLSQPMARYIDYAYRSADAIVAVSETYAERANRINLRNPPLLSVFLGNDAERFFNARDKHAADYPCFTIGYVGTLSYSYDIECVIDAIKILNDTGKYPRINFLVMGDGPLQERFAGHAKSVGVSCDFTGRLPYEEMVGRLCKCDMVVNPIVKGAAQSITNKTGDFALSGLPVANTQECVEYRKLIENYACGINCEPGNPADLAEAIAKLITNPEMRKTMGENALRLGLERFDRRTSYLGIIRLLDTL
ncbi:MAG: glycosyltransferase family 4 protein [Muribaculaceae bacterium]|nr:glycosyltransferase family 4 protein [Muribaculaceae bacterium]